MLLIDLLTIDLIDSRLIFIPLNEMFLKLYLMDCFLALENNNFTLEIITLEITIKGDNFELARMLSHINMFVTRQICHKYPHKYVLMCNRVG